MVFHEIQHGKHHQRTNFPPAIIRKHIGRMHLAGTFDGIVPVRAAKAKSDDVIIGLQHEQCLTP
tara:strand:- start:8169 stop:8360 length:192 start_codon:yes stop_codon:yes gene_type:complete